MKTEIVRACGKPEYPEIEMPCNLAIDGKIERNYVISRKELEKVVLKK
jgi:hypothetical protein